MAAATNIRYLNVRNRWPGFVLSGLVIRPDGALALGPVPAGGTAVGVPLDPVPALAGPAGVGVDRDGNVYVADPARHRILRVDGCDGTVRPLPCLTGPGEEPGRLDTPRGLVVGPRGSLYVADSGNHRVQVVDLATGQLRGIWGQPDPWGAPAPGSEPGRLDDPWDLAVDAAGFLYVADHGNARVQKFDVDGRVVPGFWEAVLTQPSVPVEPAYVTATSYGDAERLLVLDSAGPSLLVYTVDGVLDEVATGRWADLPLHPDGGLVFAGGVLYIGDQGQGRVLTFDTKGGFLGTAAGYAGAARYLALDRRGRLLVHPGSGGPVTRLDPAAAYATSGSFVAGPISVDTSAHRWDRVVAVADPLPAGAHVRFSTYVGASAPADDLIGGPAASGWQAAPPDALDLLVSGAPGRSLWLRGELRGDGATTPALHQLRVTYDDDGYLRYLPAIFREAEPGTFLGRALALMESFLGDAETTIDDLPVLFDPAVTPDTGSPSWLDWLASWIDFPLAETWDADRRRSVTAAAFAGYGRRGTPTALRDHVELYAGVPVALDEPGAHVSVWSLGTVSVLGWDTVLAVAEPQGAVLDRTAVVDRSHLSTDADYGAPLFESTAHRFCVRLRARDAELPGVTGRVRDALDREKPAHTEYELCVVDDRMRVGIQSRVGLDAFVARPRDPWVAGATTRLGMDTVLPGAGDRPTAVGRDTRVGGAVRA